jgi:outer membrane biosynthesis protein TonB
MPTRNRFFLKALLPLGLLVAAVFALVRRSGDDWEYETHSPVAEDTPEMHPASQRRPAARFALVATFTTLFFAGASFTAVAGDQATRFLQEDPAALAESGELAVEGEAAPAESQPADAAPAEPEVAPVEAAPVEAAPVEAAPVTEATEAVTPESAATADDAALEAQPAPAEHAPSSLVAPAPAPTHTASSSGAETSAPSAAPAAKPAVRSRPTKQWVVKRAATATTVAPEIEHEHGEPTIWLNRSLPDPTPASARLARSFAVDLVAASKRHGADWAAVLGVLRAQGERGSVPATAPELDTLASRLARKDAWKSALALSGRTSFADRAAALADLYRSVGIEGLVTGFEAAKARLTKRLLAHEDVWIYDSGREDLEAGRIDVRVIVLLNYLVERHESVTVSSLFSGHRKFARPGVVSAHIYGHAVDIAAIGGSAIAGNQEPGGVTEAAVRSVLLLPAELQPQQVISLLGLGGPSFPLRDHGDHIHVGF